MTYSRPITRRTLLASGAAALALPATAAADGNKPLTVIELFTSQGCSSCPPADAYMGELVKRPDIVALSFNVDYWDYIGWRDTLASPAFSRRQRAYAQKRGDGQVYTPQMVINGRHHAVGSRRDQVETLIKSELKKAATDRVALTLGQSGAEVTLDVAASPDKSAKFDATVWIAMVQPSVTVPIARGENTGREITYFNVVRKFIPAGMWHGKALHLSLPRADLFTDGASACCAIVQQGSAGPILGVDSFGPMHG